MKWNPSRHRAQTALEHLDGLMDCYLMWRVESHSVTESYRHWTLAPRADRSSAFSRYAAALDREEEAAAAYRSSVEAADQPLPHHAARLHGYEAALGAQPTVKLLPKE